VKPAKSGILAINGGSSSIKFVLYEGGEAPKRRIYGAIDRIGLSGTNLTFSDAENNRHDSRILTASDHKAAATFLIDWIEEQYGFESVQAVGHRVVHGMHHTAPELVTQELLDELHEMSPYDPERLPGEIEVIERFRRNWPR
jgi:acetate kinase